MEDTNITIARLDVTDAKLRRGGDKNFADLKAATPASVAGRPIHPFSLYYTAPVEGAVPVGGKLVVLAMPYYEQNPDFTVGIGGVNLDSDGSYALHSVNPPVIPTSPAWAAQLTVERGNGACVDVLLTRNQLEQLVRLLVMRLYQDGVEAQPLPSPDVNSQYEAAIADRDER